MSTTLTQPAVSSPATTAPMEVPKGDSAYAKWRMTGELPEPQAESAPAPETHPAEGEKPEAKIAPVSEAGNKQEPRRSNADTRLNDILDDLREAGLTPKALKTFKNDYQRSQTEPTNKPAPEQTAKPVIDPKAPVKPKQEDFEGKPWAEYDAARDKYFEELADYKATKAIEGDRQRRAAETQQRDLQEKVTAAEKRYGETAKTTIDSTAKTIFNDAALSPLVKGMVNDSPVLVDLLYALGSKGDDLADFVSSAKSNPTSAVRKLVLIEKLVIEELAKGGMKAETDRTEDGKFKAPEKKTTTAPPPPTEVSGQRGAPPDEVEAAVKTNDFRTFRTAQNRSDLQRLKGH